MMMNPFLLPPFLPALLLWTFERLSRVNWSKVSRVCAAVCRFVTELPPLIFSSLVNSPIPSMSHQAPY
jgi:hypothetical protein